jgi:hypothetical protein
MKLSGIAPIVVEVTSPSSGPPIGARLGAWIDDDGAHVTFNGSTLLIPSGHFRPVVAAALGGIEHLGARAEEYQEAPKA